jgi:hypothetical protein
MVNHLLDVGEKNLGDLAIGADDFDGGPAERLRAAEIMNSPTYASAIVGDDFDILAIEHSLQFFHHREKIVHDLSSLLLL